MSRRRTVFVSYAHADESWRQRLVRQLGVLERQGLLDLWHDRQIGGGDDWQGEIEAAMARAEVAVLLVTASFLNSSFILDEEVPRLLERQRSAGLTVLPILAEPCPWEAVPWLAKLQMRPLDGRPLSAGDDHQQKSDLAAVASEILGLVTGTDEGHGGPVEEGTLELRAWPPPKVPEEPYPLILPYTHPDLLAGRDGELADLRRQLGQRVPILGLYAPSGAGKSSLLQAGLVPALHAERRPVAYELHPQDPGLAGRLLGQLLTRPDGERPAFGDDLAAFVDALRTVRRLAGAPALLVLDQFEDVLRSTEARARVGPLLAVTVGEQLAVEEPLCRWLLAHRRDHHGELKDWLDDVLAEARDGAGLDVTDLPHELSTPDRFQAWRLKLLGALPPGDDTLAVPLAAFRAAIEKPLAQLGDDGRPRYPHSFAGDGAERLARAFAEARRDQREAPLTPELQAVLAHLVRTATEKPGGGLEIRVDPEPDALLSDALSDHLRRALADAFPSGGRAAAQRGRTRALLALRELADAHGRTDEGLPASRLAAALGADGPAILERLAGPGARLIVPQAEADGDGKRYRLSHDRLAEVVVRAEEEEGVHLDVDRELLRLRKLVELRTGLYQEGDVRQATDLGRRQYQRVRDNAEALLWDEERHAWWAACRRRRRQVWRRRSIAAAVVVGVAVLGGYLVKRWWRQQDLLVGISREQPEEAFIALDQLLDEGVSTSRLAKWLREREGGSLLRFFEAVPAEMANERRFEARLAAVRTLLATRVDGELEPKDLLGVMAWALDDLAAREPSLALEAQGLRVRLFEPYELPPAVLREDLVELPDGKFTMGSPEGEGHSDEQPAHEVEISPFCLQAHEVTLGAYRQWVPDHEQRGEDHEDHHPAVDVSWYEAYAYAAWLGGRLPTEAEWEYAARFGCEHDFCDRSGARTDLENIAWFGEGFGSSLHPVKTKDPNQLGLYDLNGNAWEWVSDWYDVYSGDSEKDPLGPAAGGGERVIRGGSAWDSAGWARSALRYRDVPWLRLVNLGFRVVLLCPRAGGGS